MFYRTLLLAGFFITLLLVGQACSSKQAPPTVTPPEIVVAEIVPRSIAYYDEYPATVVALKQVDLIPQVTGYVTSIRFKDGDWVPKGKLLYTIDTETYEAVLQNAKANLQVREADLVKAQKDMDRYNELLARNAVARQQVDYAEAALMSAQKAVEAARAEVDNVRTNVKFTSIYAPFSGTIGVSQVRVGTALFSGQTVMNTISTDDPMAVDFNVGQDKIFRLSSLEEGARRADKIPFQLVFDNYVYPRTGRIYFLDRAVETQSGTIKVRVSFPNPTHVLKAGMTGVIRIPTATQKSVIVIPQKAMVEQMGEYYVFVVSDSLIAKQQYIKTVRTVRDSVVVSSGLKVGEQLVVSGVQKLRDGMHVRLQADTAREQK